MNEVYLKVDELGWVSDYYFKNKDIITIEELVGALEDAICEKERIEEKYKDYKQNVEDNYRRIPESEMYGVYDSDFM